MPWSGMDQPVLFSAPSRVGDRWPAGQGKAGMANLCHRLVAIMALYILTVWQYIVQAGVQQQQQQTVQLFHLRERVKVGHTYPGLPTQVGD